LRLRHCDLPEPAPGLYPPRRGREHTTIGV